MTPQCKALLAKYTKEYCDELWRNDPAGVDRILAQVLIPLYKKKLRRPRNKSHDART